MRNKKAIICLLSISTAIALFSFNKNTSTHESEQIISMQSDYNIENETVNFETPEIPSFQKNISVQSNIIEEKIADISQKYIDVNLQLNTVKKTNIYKEDSLDSSVLTTVDYYTNIKCIGEDMYNDEGFYKVEYNNEIGFVQKTLLTDDVMFYSTDKRIIVTNPTILYEDPTKENIITTLEGNMYSIDIENDEWIRISYNNLNGYINIKEANNEILQKTDNVRYLVSKSDVYDFSMNKTSAKNITSNVLYSNNNYSIIENNGNTYVVKNSNLTDKVPASVGAVEFAYSMLGVKYSYGSASTKSTDCSGLTMQCYKSQGITIPRTAAEQYRSGTKISYDNIQPGDLIAWSNNGGKSVSHIGIYIGNGEFIHASSGKGEVMISNVSEYKKYSTYVGAVRY